MKNNQQPRSTQIIDFRPPHMREEPVEPPSPAVPPAVAEGQREPDTQATLTKFEAVMLAHDGIDRVLDPKNLWDFLSSKGFRRFWGGLVYLDGMILKPCSDLDLRKWIISYFEARQVDDSNMHNLSKKLEQLTKPSKRDNLKDFDGELLYRPRKDDIRLFFGNCYVRIDNKGKCVQHDYTDLDLFITEDMIKALDLPSNFGQIVKTKPLKSPFALFLADINTDPDTKLVNNEMQLNTLAAFGYLCHHLKSRSFVALLGLCEIPQPGQNNAGRTGKTLFMEGVKRAWCYNDLQSPLYCEIDGRVLNPKYDHNFNEITPFVTRVMGLDDLDLKRYPISMLFKMTTGGMTVNPKGKRPVTIPYKDVPKMIFSTNQPQFSGTDDSDLGRISWLEFTRYYNKNHQPIDKYGREFFEDWNDGDWVDFYVFVCHCIMLSMKYKVVDKGLPYPSMGPVKRALVHKIGEDIVEYLDAEVKACEDAGKAIEINKDDLNRQIEQGALKPGTNAKAASLVKDYCRLKDLIWLSETTHPHPEPDKAPQKYIVLKRQ